MILNTVINSVIIMGFLIGIGFFLARKGIVTSEVETAFTFMLLNIAIPALVLNAFNIEYSPEKIKLGLRILTISFVFTLVTVIINNLLVAKVKNKNKKKVMLYTNALTNCGFMGFPVVYQIYGTEGTFFASMFYIPIVFFMWTYGMSVFYDSIGKKEFKAMLFNPNMVSVYIGLVIFIFSIDIPVLGEKIINTVGAITTPLAMFIIGARVGRVKLRDMLNDVLVYYSTVIKLIFFPILMIIVLQFIDMEPMLKGVCLIYAALPPPAITVVIANQFDCEVDFSSKIIVMTHVLSLVTIPLMFAIFELF